MTDSGEAFLVLVLTALGSGLLAHWRIHRFPAASLVATLLSAVAFQAVAIWQQGYLDPFAPIALAASLIITAPIALLAGLPFLALRRRRQAIPDQNAGA